MEAGEQVPWTPYGNIPVMLMVTLSPVETSGVYGVVEVTPVRGLRMVANGFVGGCILLRCCLFTFFL